MQPNPNDDPPQGGGHGGAAPPAAPPADPAAPIAIQPLAAPNGDPVAFAAHPAWPPAPVAFAAPPPWYQNPPPFPPPWSEPLKYRALGPHESPRVWLNHAETIYHANQEAPIKSVLRALEALRDSGTRGMQLASAVEANQQALASWHSFRAAVIQNGGDDRQTREMLWSRIRGLRATVGKDAETTVDQFKTLVNELKSIDPAVAEDIDTRGTDSMTGRLLRQYFVGIFSEAPEFRDLSNELQKQDIQGRPLAHLYAAVGQFQTRKVTYGGWSYAFPEQAQSETLGINVAAAPSPVVSHQTARSVPQGVYDGNTGRFVPRPPMMPRYPSRWPDRRPQAAAHNLNAMLLDEPPPATQPLLAMGNAPPSAPHAGAPPANASHPVGNFFCDNCFEKGHWSRRCGNPQAAAPDDVRRFARLFNMLPPGFVKGRPFQLSPELRAACDDEARARSVQAQAPGRGRGRGFGYRSRGGHPGQPSSRQLLTMYHDTVGAPLDYAAQGYGPSFESYEYEGDDYNYYDEYDSEFH